MAVNLQKEAILVTVTIKQGSVWGKSPTLANEAAEKHGADPASVSGSIIKLDKTVRAAIVNIMGQARQVLYKHTLPWDDGGYRLCPIAQYETLKRELLALQNAFYDAVQDVLDRYEELRADYHRRVPGILAQEVPFPTYQEMQSSFRFELRELLLADPNDIRLNNVSDSVVAEIQAKVQAATNARVGSASELIVKRLIERVERVAEQCGKEKGKIYETLITNIQDDMAILPDLNITNDPKVTALIDRVRSTLAGLDFEDIRRDQGTRLHAAKLAENVLDDLRSFTAGTKVKKAVTPAPAAPVTVAEAPAPVKPTMTEAELNAVVEEVLAAPAPVTVTQAKPTPKVVLDDFDLL